MAWMLLWIVLLLLVTFAWWTRHGAITRAQWKHPALSSRSYSGPPDNPPHVSVLIAAKDEELNIERAVRSILRQDYPSFELIVIDDRSRDRTPQILDSLEAQDATGRLRVLHVRELRDGWFGKNNAMREGVAVARGEWLLFSDADCEQTSVNSLSVAVRHSLEWQFDFLSIIPRHEMHGLWEQIVQPVGSMLLMFWHDPKRVNNPKNPSAYANGAFMLMKRACYDVIGGHERVKTAVNEDVHMARLAKEAGQRLFVCRNEDLYTVRMYSGFRQIWRGWSRIFYGTCGSFRPLVTATMMLLALGVLPYASLLAVMAEAILTGRWALSPGWIPIAASAVLAIAMQQSVIVRFYRLGSVKRRLAPTFLIGSAVCIGMLINAMFKLRGRAAVTWRGTTYRGDQVVAAPAVPAGKAPAAYAGSSDQN